MNKDYLIGLLLFGLGLGMFALSLYIISQREAYCKAVESEYKRIKNEVYIRERIIKI